MLQWRRKKVIFLRKILNHEIHFIHVCFEPNIQVLSFTLSHMLECVRQGWLVLFSVVGQHQTIAVMASFGRISKLARGGGSKKKNTFRKHFKPKAVMYELLFTVSCRFELENCNKIVVVAACCHNVCAFEWIQLTDVTKVIYYIVTLRIKYVLFFLIGVDFKLTKKKKEKPKSKYQNGIPPTNCDFRLTVRQS